MKIYEVVEKLSIKTTKADVAKMQSIHAKMKQAAASGDADTGFQAGAELGDMLMNKVYPDLLQVGAYIVNELEKACAKYSKKDPKWNQACKDLPQTKMAILKQIHGQGLKPFQGTQKRGEKIINIFGKSYIVPANTQPESMGEQTNASSIATVSGNVGTMQSRSMYNADGTMKNGADFGNLLGGKKKAKKTRKA